MNQNIYYFSQGYVIGNHTMTDILGGKGANLAQMCKIGLPIPPGFTISSELCKLYQNSSDYYNASFQQELEENITRLESDTGKKFGSKENPLLISVRSGAKVSMPGMMDSILNLGMNDDVAEGLAKQTNNPRFAYDSYRRFLEMFASVVLAIPGYLFELRLQEFKDNLNLESDSELDENSLKEIISSYKQIIKKHSGKDFESSPKKQLKLAVDAVFASWMSSRAIAYRNINNIKDLSGTAVNIQAMVFGNKCENSGTGVVFTRCPSIGENKIFGEYLRNAQGEDVVAGIRTPLSIVKENDNDDSLEVTSPELYEELKSICKDLENYYKDMQDIEFTIEEGKLYILQTRSGKKTCSSAVKIAVDMVKEGMKSKEEAILDIDPEAINQLLHTAVDYNSKPKIIDKGLPASPGAASGIVVFSSEEAELMKAQGRKTILVRNDTSPEDIKGMYSAEGILTARGGMTSHAAVVARGMGKPCVCGVFGLKVNESDNYFIMKSGERVNHGDFITIDGSSGNIITGEVKLVTPEFSNEFQQILDWSDEIKSMEVRGNAENVNDLETAIRFGAGGVGLCRSEHMFFEKDRLSLIRQMIIAQTKEHKNQALAKLKPLHKQDFKDLLRVMNGLPINIRLLDPPLHEFLPKESSSIKDIAKLLDLSEDFINTRISNLHEFNPMLGHRGCRLGISFPEIYDMQIESILEAIIEIQEEGIDSKVEIMVPLVSELEELRITKKQIVEKIKTLNLKTNIKIGTMIELPRAAIISDKIATEVDYFSFGSNDLTQTTYGISRDDIGSFLPDYIEKGIFKSDPFVEIDREGVGQLIKMSIEKGKKVNPDIRLGICGEHAGDPNSIEFFQECGFDYISCSPYRIPAARVAAAKATIKMRHKS